MPQDIDILVIGAGACGLAAAIAGHDAGASVAIVEKRAAPGGNSSLSTGSIPGAGTRYQRAAGIDDQSGASHRRSHAHRRRDGLPGTGAAPGRAIRAHRGVAGRLRRRPVCRW